MTQLKHIIIIVLLLFAFGQAAKAQSSALQPYEGAMHAYTCNGISVGADYNFYITANADGSGVYDDGLTGEFDILNAKGLVGDDGLATTHIQWNTGASAHIYFVWLEATAQGGCSNYIRIQISPQINRFDMLSENIPVDNTMSCPAVASADGFNALASNYDAGTTSLKFVIRRVNGTDNKQTPVIDDSYDWAFEPVLAIDPSQNLDISIVSVVGINSGNLVADSNKLYTVNGADDEVTVTVAIKNMPGTIQEVSLKIRNQIEAHTNLSDSNVSNDVVKHRIDIMPVINDLQGV